MAPWSASCPDPTRFGSIFLDPSRSVSIRLDSSFFVSIRLDSSRFVSFRLDSSLFVSIRLAPPKLFTFLAENAILDSSRFVSFRLDSSRFVSFRLDSSLCCPFCDIPFCLSRISLLDSSRFVSFLLLEGTLGPKRGIRDRTGGRGLHSALPSLPRPPPHHSYLREKDHTPWHPPSTSKSALPMGNPTLDIIC